MFVIVVEQTNHRSSEMKCPVFAAKRLIRTPRVCIGHHAVFSIHVSLGVYFQKHTKFSSIVMRMMYKSICLSEQMTKSKISHCLIA